MTPESESQRHERRERIERSATLLAAIACLLVVAMAWTPRLVPRPAAPRPEQPDVVVAIQGAVRSPGRYELPWGARVDDLVDAAGGLAPDAADELVDLVAPLVDGSRVHVPRRRVDAVDARISINEASVAELERLSGVGPTIAQRIVAQRPFQRIDDLERVRGIGPATLRALRDHVTL